MNTSTRRQRIFALSVAAAILTGAGAETASAAPAGGGATPGAAGIGDTAQPHAGNGGYDVLDYGLAMVFSKDLARQSNVTTLHGRATQALSRFDLDLQGPAVRAVTVNGRPARWAQVGPELQVTPATPIAKGETFVVRTEVTAAVPEETKAQKSQGVMSFGLERGGGAVQTMNQPVGARRMAALADHPAQKAPATISITAPSQYTSVANGDLVSTRRHGTATTRVFRNRQALAPELIQIGVGHLSVIHRSGPHGIRLRHVVPTNMVARVMPQLDRDVPTIINTLTATLGPFPDRTYGVYAAPMGAQLETQGLTSMPTNQLTQPYYNQNGTAGILTHEIAHEYFGDSVSPRRWSDVWLNEGQASYYSFVADPHAHDITSTMKGAYRATEADLKKDGPVAAPHRERGMPAGSAPYNNAIYMGGAATLYALNQKVGQRTFDAIQRTWVQSHRNSTGSTSEYIALASKVAGRDLAPFLKSWLYTTTLPKMPGHPDW